MFGRGTPDALKKVLDTFYPTEQKTFIQTIDVKLSNGREEVVDDIPENPPDDILKELEELLEDMGEDSREWLETSLGVKKTLTLLVKRGTMDTDDGERTIVHDSKGTN